MAKERVQRRLAAILAADVVEYSRLMEQDEAGTLTMLKARWEMLKPLIARHHGRIFKVAGDGVLVEFASAVNAVQCAIDLQHAMGAANGDLLEDRRIVLRIGINLGDVVVDGGDRYGDGVNIAARLEAIAEPGGILVSGTIYDHARNKIDASFEDLGSQGLKNLTEPVRVYRISGMPRVRWERRKAPEKTSVAVLPFANLSGDSGQDYFSDGTTEDIITELARNRSLSVIARTHRSRSRTKRSKCRRSPRSSGRPMSSRGAFAKPARVSASPCN
jgi:adenylate cyclase